MLVPVTNRVNGMIAVINTRNGSERPTLITHDSGVCSVRFSKSPPGARLCTSAPSGTPTSNTITMTIDTISTVSTKAGMSKPGISLTGTVIEATS